MATSPPTPINLRPAPRAALDPAIRGKKTEGFELFLTLLVLAVIMWLFRDLHELAKQNNGRFSSDLTEQIQLPEQKSLPKACRQFGGHATPETAALCSNLSIGAETLGERLPVWLEQKITEIRDAFAKPILEKQEWQKREALLMREGLADEEQGLLEKKEIIQSIEAKLQPYLEKYEIPDDAVRQGPLPLQCLRDLADSTWRETQKPEVRAGLALWLAAALDGTTPQNLDNASHLALDQAWHGPGARLKRESHSWLSSLAHRACAEYATPGEVAGKTASIITQARDNATEIHKAAAMQNLLKNAWWYWPIWGGVGWLLVALSRRAPALKPTIGLALMGWAALAWKTTVHGWVPGFEWVYLAVGVAGLVLYLVGLLSRSAGTLNYPQQICTSAFAYPGFILFAGLGWLFLMDYSTTGPYRNRYLGLYQYDNLFLAFSFISLVSILRYPLGAFLTRVPPLVRGIFSGSQLSGRTERWTRMAVRLVITIVAIVVSVFLLSSPPQVTSEVGRVWLILGTAWFFYMRGNQVFNPNNVSDSGIGWFLRFLSPLLLVLLTLAALMVATNDMGPLLIIIYGGGVFLASATAFALRHRGSGLLPIWIGTALIVMAWMVLVSGAVFALGAWHSTTAGRLESMTTPLAANNDQMALVSWFRQHTPAFGYGVGGVPWCGQTTPSACHGMPLQTQSDYVFSALWGLFGPVIAWGLSLVMLLWLYLLARRHPDITTGKPTMMVLNERKVWDVQPFLSWLCVTWIALTACQLAVTVAGNLRVLPLSGVTYPFISYGTISLCVNAIFLGFCLSLNIKKLPQS